MRSFLNLHDFWEFYVEARSKAGFRRSVIDAYHVQVLQKYRLAAAFAIPILDVVKDLDKNVRPGIVKAIDECEGVLADESIFVVAGRRNPKLSKYLEERVERADDAIVYAGGILNDVIPLLSISECTLLICLRARDLCDAATKRMRFG